MKRFLFFLMLSLMLAACGGEETAPASTTGATQSATATETAVATETTVATQTPVVTETAEATPVEMATMQPAPTNPPAETIELDIKGFLFRPEELVVTPGTTIVWTNRDDIQHTVTHGTPDDPGSAFDSDFFYLGEQFSHTFREPGTYQYFCERHNHMQATIIVEPAGG